MLNRTNLMVAAATALATLSILAFAAPDKPPISSTVFDWNTIEAKTTKAGSVRNFFRGSTAALGEFACHVTTLNPNEAPHGSHTHPEEELIIVKDGAVECSLDGQTKVVGPGSVIFHASNQLHGIRNAGKVAASYYVIKWKAKELPKH